jgi:hypothetical protein
LLHRVVQEEANLSLCGAEDAEIVVRAIGNPTVEEAKRSAQGEGRGERGTYSSVWLAGQPPMGPFMYSHQAAPLVRCESP